MEFRLLSDIDHEPSAEEFAEHLLNQGRIVPDKLAQDFASRHIFGIGKSTRQFVRALSRYELSPPSLSL